MALIAVFLAVFKDWRKYLSPGRACDRLACRGGPRTSEDSAPLLPRHSQPADFAKLGAERHRTRDRAQRRGYHRSRHARPIAQFAGVRFASPCWTSLLSGATMISANPDAEVLNAIRASMATFGSDAMVIAGSSPYARRGVLWDAFRRWHGKDDARNLVWQAATRTMNPTVPQDFIDAEFERDPASANAEYGAEFRSDIAAFVELAVLEACTADGVFEIPPMSGNELYCFRRSVRRFQRLDDVCDCAPRG